MGFNTSVIVMNDSLSAIKDDPEFGKNLYDAVLRVGSHQNDEGFTGIDVPAKYNANAATVVETHHADMTSVVTFGKNYGDHLGTFALYGEESQALKIARELAEAEGYKLVRK